MAPHRQKKVKGKQKNKITHEIEKRLEDTLEKTTNTSYDQQNFSLIWLRGTCHSHTQSVAHFPFHYPTTPPSKIHTQTPITQATTNTEIGNNSSMRWATRRMRNKGKPNGNRTRLELKWMEDLSTLVPATSGFWFINSERKVWQI